MTKDAEPTKTTTEEATATAKATTKKPTTKKVVTTTKKVTTVANNGSPEKSGNVWIPESGKKYHNNPDFSNMKNPSKVTVSKAESLGYTPCKKCY